MKKIYLSLLVLVVLAISGCQSDGGISRGGSAGVGGFIGGTQGLVLDFIDDAPASSGNFIDDSIAVELSLINKGEEDVNVQNVYIKGALASLTEVDTDNLDGLSGNPKINDVLIVKIEEGEEGKVEQDLNIPLGTFKYTGDILSDSVPLTVVAEVCYPYKTKLQVNNLCVPSKSDKIVGTAECEVDSVKNLIVSGSNSAAPIQVDSLTESRLGRDSIRITLNINNRGTGRALSACAREPSEDTLDVVNVKVPANYECSTFDGANEGNVELRDGSARVLCTRTIQETGNPFEEPFNAILTYSYVEEATKEITISKI